MDDGSSGTGMRMLGLVLQAIIIAIVLFALVASRHPILPLSS